MIQKMCQSNTGLPSVVLIVQITVQKSANSNLCLETLVVMRLMSVMSCTGTPWVRFEKQDNGNIIWN